MSFLNALVQMGNSNTFMREPTVELTEEAIKESGATHVILGAPFEQCCVYRPGAGMGPQAIRMASEQFMSYNFDLDIDLHDYIKLADAGDACIIPGNAKLSHDNIESAVDTIVKAGAFPIVLGGDHSIPHATVKTIMKHNPNKKIGMIFFDTHMDTAREYAGESLSNCTAPAVLADAGMIQGKNIVQIGIRGCMNPKSERDNAEELGITIFSSRDVRKRGMDEIIKEAIRIASDGTDSIYVTVDIDCLDPAYGPGTCAPSPTGLTSWELVDACLELGKLDNVIGFDLCEVAPMYDAGDITARAACRAICEFLGGVALRKRGK